MLHSGKKENETYYAKKTFKTIYLLTTYPNSCNTYPKLQPSTISYSDNIIYFLIMLL